MEEQKAGTKGMGGTGCEVKARKEQEKNVEVKAGREEKNHQRIIFPRLSKSDHIHPSISDTTYSSAYAASRIAMPGERGVEEDGAAGKDL